MPHKPQAVPEACVRENILARSASGFRLCPLKTPTSSARPLLERREVTPPALSLGNPTNVPSALSVAAIPDCHPQSCPHNLWTTTPHKAAGFSDLRLLRKKAITAPTPPQHWSRKSPAPSDPCASFSIELEISTRHQCSPPAALIDVRTADERELFGAPPEAVHWPLAVVQRFRGGAPNPLARFFPPNRVRPRFLIS